MDQGQLTIAFTAGILATLAPCSLPMLPALLASRLGGSRSVSRSLMEGVLLTAGFNIVFSVIGVVPSLALGATLQGNTLLLRVIGGVLVLLGLIRGFTDVLDRVPRVEFASGSLGSLAWGVGYGASSLGCSLPVFILVVLQGSAAATPADTLLLFAVFASGSAVFLIPASVGVALAEETVADRLLSVLPYVKKAAALLMVFAGSYMVWSTLGS